MAAIEPNEIRPGLNVFLDAALLATLPGVLSNTRMVAHNNRAADDFRPFLIVEVDEDGVCLCVPLFSRFARDRIELDQSLKTGPGRGWSERPSYFSPYQFWMIPSDCLIAASAREMNAVGRRQRYGDHAPDALAAIAARRNDSDTDYHPFSN